LVSKDKIDKNIKVLDFLIDINYINILEHLIKESSDIPGTQNKVYQTICSLGKQTVKKLLTENKSSSTKTSLMKLSKECKDNTAVFFSYDLIEKKASIYSSMGIKEFVLGNIENSIKYMKEAIKLDRNYFLYYWNLARLLSINRNLKASKKVYEKAIDLIKISEYKDKENLEKRLKKEMDNFSLSKHGKPVSKLLE
jgi:tetratricopeptide (TPR) repeat protein